MRVVEGTHVFPSFLSVSFVNVSSSTRSKDQRSLLLILPMIHLRHRREGEKRDDHFSSRFSVVFLSLVEMICFFGTDGERGSGKNGVVFGLVEFFLG